MYLLINIDIACLRRYQMLALVLGLIASTMVGCSSPNSRPTTRGDDSALSVARKMLGVRYRYGGVSPRTGFDCSGLVYYSHKKVGVRLPRTTMAQFQASLPVSRNKLRKGDLVFFRIKGTRVAHVGIYIGKNRFIHAPSSGKQVSIAKMTNPYWAKRFLRGGRV